MLQLAVSIVVRASDMQTIAVGSVMMNSKKNVNRFGLLFHGCCTCTGEAVCLQQMEGADAETVLHDLLLPCYNRPEGSESSQYWQLPCSVVCQISEGSLATGAPWLTPEGIDRYLCSLKMHPT